ncbi:fibrillin-3-like [Sycon ciliatum]|uniref:fibrillin-3-like n=1 Tax=Sycon ciliatum TaxID=27933 RepID=UPI0031F70D59
MCMCNPGFTGTGMACQDLDECSLGTHSCAAEANCSNTQGSFMCMCNPGFTGTGMVCQDLDECSLGTHSCAAEANCSNTQGSFMCMCNPGFTGTGMVCQDLDECSLGTHSCAAEANCSNTQGSFMCMCNPGFTGTGMACQDLDECSLGVDSCAAEANCSNTQGSFICICNPGFTGTGMVCQDLDECSLGTHSCAAEANCSNTQGSFMCMCNPGFTGTGMACQDLDECSLGVDSCAAEANCSNTQGSFICICNPGFTGTGMVCQDLDECSLGTHSCAAEANCSNTKGSFMCMCNPGFTGTGMVCQDLDECSLGTHSCAAEANCSNTKGSFMCMCNAGFTGTGMACQDLDECSLGTHSCAAEANCSNTQGSFMCMCNPGFTGTGMVCQMIAAWLYLPATLGPFSRSSIARRDVLHPSYEDAVGHCATIGYYLGSEENIRDWHDNLRSDFITIARDNAGPYYTASSAANPRVVSIFSSGSVKFSNTDNSPGRPYRSLCFVLCNNGFMDTSVPSAPVCRCLPGWVGKRCEKRAVDGFASTISWVVPNTGRCKPTYTAPLQCAQSGRYQWQPAQGSCDQWYSSIATQLPLHSPAASAFHRLVSELTVAGFHHRMSVWLNNTGVGSLYSLSREALSAPHINTSVTGDPVGDIICQADWTHTKVMYMQWHARVAVKAAPPVTAADLWMIPVFCSAMNMSMPQYDSRFQSGLFYNAMRQLGFAGPEFNIPVQSLTYGSSFYIARILSPSHSLINLTPGKLQPTYSPVCIKLCSARESLSDFNECLP